MNPPAKEELDPEEDNKQVQFAGVKETLVGEIGQSDDQWDQDIDYTGLMFLMYG